METDAAGALRAHYLKVQALSPIGDSVAQNPVAPQTSQSFFSYFSENPTSAALIIFVTFMIVGILALLITRVRNVNTILTLLFIAFMTSTIPFGTQLITKQTQLESQAGPMYTPKEVIIDNVTATGFTISWDTDSLGLGAVRLKKSPTDTGEIPTIVPEPDKPPVTHHEVVVSNLQSQKLYYIDILSGAEWYNNEGQPLEVKTR